MFSPAMAWVRRSYGAAAQIGMEFPFAKTPNKDIPDEYDSQ